MDSPSGHSGQNAPALSVVMASVESRFTLGAALDAVARACAELAPASYEILVADASHDDSAEIARAHPACDHVIERGPGTLVPVLWAAGIRASRGRWVALTTGHCVPSRGWAVGLVEALEDGAQVAGAGLLPLPQTRPLDCAILLLRYARFLDLTTGNTRSVEDVPGDNAAYPGDRLREFVTDESHGFWELEYHRKILDEGGEIRAVPAATVGFGRSFPLATITRHRLDHARQFGASRARSEGRARVVLPAPLVPLLMLARTARMAWPFRGLRGAFVRAVPAFLFLASTWAGGEAVGALFGPSRELEG